MTYDLWPWNTEHVNQTLVISEDREFCAHCLLPMSKLNKSCEQGMETEFKPQKSQGSRSQSFLEGVLLCLS